MTGNIEDLYVSDEPVEIEVHGVTFKVREPNAEEYAEMQKSAVTTAEDGQSVEFNLGEFNKAIIKHCVIEPEIDLNRLKGRVFTQLVRKIQDEFHLAESEDFFGTS